MYYQIFKTTVSLTVDHEVVLVCDSMSLAYTRNVLNAIRRNLSFDPMYTEFITIDKNTFVAKTDSKVFIYNISKIKS